MAIADDLRDKAVLRAIYIARYSESAARRIVRLLEKADADLEARIARRLARVTERGFDTGPTTTKRLTELRAAIQKQSADIHATILSDLSAELVELGAVVQAHQAADFAELMPAGVDLGLLRPSPELLRAAVDSKPFQGRLLKSWVADLDSANVRDIMSAIQLGIVEGMPSPAIVERAVAATDLSKRRAGILVRTSVNHIATRARELLYEKNADLVGAVQWVATLDSRTTEICASRDGKTFPIDSGPRPPAHPNCRSTTAPVLRSWAELAGPKALKPERGADNIEELFQAQLAKQGFKADEIAAIKRDQRASFNSMVSASTTYPQWLKRQPRNVVEDVLGVAKADLFLSGALSLDKFLDSKSGRPFSLAELRRRHPAAFRKAAA